MIKKILMVVGGIVVFVGISLWEFPLYLNDVKIFPFRFASLGLVLYIGLCVLLHRRFTGKGWTLDDSTSKCSTCGHLEECHDKKNSICHGSDGPLFYSFCDCKKFVLNTSL